MRPEVRELRELHRRVEHLQGRRGPDQPRGLVHAVGQEGLNPRPAALGGEFAPE